MSRKNLIPCILSLCAFSALAQSAPQTPAATKPAPAAQQSHQDDPQRTFDQHCSRCHTTPDGFSPHISGTVVMHMRVRGNISAHDAEELRRFFNP